MCRQIIYCNMDRVQKDNDGHYVDTCTYAVLALISIADYLLMIATGNVLVSKSNNLLDGCKGLSDLTLAFTWIPEATWMSINGEPQRRFYHPSQITICPWFLEWARGHEYRVRMALTIDTAASANGALTDVERRL